MTTPWPPPGHFSWYEVTEHFSSPAYELHYDLSLPSSLNTFDISTLRVGRHGGPNDADATFRRELFLRIGAVTAAGGQVECAMKRVLLLLTSESGLFSLVDKSWSDLHLALRRACDGSDGRRLALVEVLDWGDAHDVKSRRDNVVHANWWLFAGCGARRSRFFRRTDGSTILATLNDLDDDAAVLFDYADRLDGLLGSDWPIAMLPIAD